MTKPSITPLFKKCEGADKAVNREDAENAVRTLLCYLGEDVTRPADGVEQVVGQLPTGTGDGKRTFSVP